MSYSARPSFLSRTAALTLSVAVQLVLGLALLYRATAGTPDASTRFGEQGEALVIELLPLPDGGAPGTDRERKKAPRQDKPAVSVNGGGDASLQRAGVAQTIGSPARGDGGSDATSGSGIQNDRDSAPLPSGAEIQAFRERLLRHIERFRRYPPAAREGGEEGVAQVRFVMDDSGKVIDAWIERSSGSPLLDEEALAAIMRARPLPTPPSSWPHAFGVVLPIDFALQ